MKRVRQGVAWLIGLSLPVLFAQGSGTEVWSLAVSPDGKWVAAGYNDGEVALWDIATGKAVRPLRSHADHIRSVAFSLDGTRLASASDDGFIRIQETSTGQILKEFREPWTGYGYPRVFSVRFSPDGNAVVTGALQLALWDINTGTRIRKRDYELDRGNTIGVVVAAFSPSGKSIATGDSNSIITIVDTATFGILGTLRGHSKWVRSVAFSPDGKTLASSSDDGKIKLWDLTSGEEARTLTGDAEVSMSVAFHPGGKFVASAGGGTSGSDGLVKIWETASGKELQTLKHTRRFDAVTFTPDGALMIAGGADGTLRVWSTATWNLERKIPDGGGLVR